jgi:hypothetical protein
MTSPASIQVQTKAYLQARIAQEALLQGHHRPPAVELWARRSKNAVIPEVVVV